MLDLGGADAEAERAERTIGGGVAVSASDQHARRHQPLLRHDDVLDPLPGIAEPVKGDVVLAAVFFEIADQKLGLLARPAAHAGRVHMINDRKMRFGSPDLQALCSQA